MMKGFAIAGAILFGTIIYVFWLWVIPCGWVRPPRRKQYLRAVLFWHVLWIVLLWGIWSVSYLIVEVAS